MGGGPSAFGGLTISEKKVRARLGIIITTLVELYSDGTFLKHSERYIFDLKMMIMMMTGSIYYFLMCEYETILTYTQIEGVWEKRPSAYTKVHY